MLVVNTQTKSHRNAWLKYQHDVALASSVLSVQHPVRSTGDPFLSSAFDAIARRFSSSADVPNSNGAADLDLPEALALIRAHGVSSRLT